MKKSLTLALFLVLGFGPAVAPVLAEGGVGINANIKANVSVGVGSNGTTTGTSTKDRGENEGVIAELKGDLRGGLRADLVTARLRAAEMVFTATINRFDRIITRIQSRLGKISAAGGSVTEAQADVNLAKGNIADAEAQLTILANINISGSTSTTTLAANFQAAKAAAKKAREDLETAKQNLIKAVQVMVKVEVGLHANATTTAGENN